MHDAVGVDVLQHVLDRRRFGVLDPHLVLDGLAHRQLEHGPEHLRARGQDELGAGEGGALAHPEGDVGEGGLVPHPGAVLDEPFVGRCGGKRETS